MNRRILALLVVELTFACSRKPAPAPEPPRERSPSDRIVSVSPALVEDGRISLEKATREELVEELTVTGEVSSPPDGAAEIGAPIAGRVREVAVKEGDHVPKGKLLAVIDTSEVAKTRAELGRARARRERAAHTLAQEERLNQEKATSERILSEARSELAAALAEERGAEALLQSFGAASGGRITLTSPIAGTVVKRAVVLGKPVEAGATLFRVVDTARLLVRADVPENDAADVAPGSSATIEWPTRRASCTGIVEPPAPSVDPVTRTVPYPIYPGPECPELVEGGFVDVTVPRRGSGRAGYVVVPRDAVVEVDGVPIVFVAGDKVGEFMARSVRVARLGSTKAHIEDGLRAEDRVAVKGAILLKGELMRAALE